MPKFIPLAPSEEGPDYMFICPACHTAHPIWVHERLGYPFWEWNGDVNKPTLHPGIIFKGVTFGMKYTCHSQIVDGKIHFLAESTHAFAGQTMELPEYSLHLLN